MILCQMQIKQFSANSQQVITNLNNHKSVFTNKLFDLILGNIYICCFLYYNDILSYFETNFNSQFLFYFKNRIKFRKFFEIL